MPLEQRGEVGEIDELQQVKDSDGNTAHAATDERLEEVRQQGENHAGLIDGQYTVSAADTAESLPDQPIPDGVEVVIVYDPANAGVVYVGDGSPSFPLTDVGQGVKLRVSNLSDISIEAPNTDDGIRYLAEVSN